MDDMQIRITGNRIHPTTLKLSELVKVLDAVETLISEVIMQQHPEFDKDALIIGLTGITDQSVGLQFSSSPLEPAIEAMGTVAAAITESKYNDLPYGAIQSLRGITAFTRHHQCDVELFAGDNTYSLARMTPDTEIQLPAPLIGETTLYGQVLRVGGKTPSVMFEPVESPYVIYPHITRDLAQKLAKRLYQWVGIYGEAKWNAITLELEDFTVYEVIPYDPQPLTESFAELRELAGGYFVDVHDVEQYVADMRATEREE